MVRRELARAGLGAAALPLVADLAWAQVALRAALVERVRAQQGSVEAVPRVVALEAEARVPRQVVKARASKQRVAKGRLAKRQVEMARVGCAVALR